MARSTIAFPALLLACFALLKLGFAEHVPQPAPGYDDSLELCIKNMTEECGIEIFQNIVHKGPPITDACCSVLLKFGHPCHSELILAVLSTGKFAPHEAEILQKSAAAWKRCRSIVEGH
ncbi:protein DOWN-REGULATED IN DIF1 11-like [Eucalyptus grandis]|uniref:protein DOWN-REGULATED IN DIF1 11-like n=1 Tax=Eucalyptus grandis TaxID=71139 RepID=UPI00192E9364|nr:protein DOWN-REGULATED IN DIF1 11-like [Eucalyptus grandis]